MTRVRPDKIELVLLLACAAILGVQLFVPPTIGLADNGDFGTVYARFALAHTRGTEDNFAYFAPRYWYPPENVRLSGIPLSEMLLATGPVWIARVAKSAVFDVRWLGVVHALLFLGAFYALLVYLRPWKLWLRLVLGCLALAIFGDVAYVAYFNSFFADTAALLGVMLLVPLALKAAADPRPGEGTLLLLAMAALLFIGAKPQHALVGIIPAAMIVAVLGRKLLAALLVCALWVVVTAAPPVSQAKSLFNVIFFKIANRSATPGSDLAELGLGPQDLPYAGMYADQKGSPVDDPKWQADFLHRTSYRKVNWFYVRHPVRTARMLGAVLHLEAFEFRPANLGNFRREEGLPPGTLSHHFNLWSRLRTAVFVRWWWHVVVWYALFLGFTVRLARNSRTAAIAAGVAVMAIGEFTVSSLSNGVETARHLLLFHLLTDVTILIAVGWLLSSGLSRAIRRDTSAAQSDLLHASS